MSLWVKTSEGRILFGKRIIKLTPKPNTVERRHTPPTSPTMVNRRRAKSSATNGERRLPSEQRCKAGNNKRGALCRLVSSSALFYIMTFSLATLRQHKVLRVLGVFDSPSIDMVQNHETTVSHRNLLASKEVVDSVVVSEQTQQHSQPKKENEEGLRAEEKGFEWPRQMGTCSPGGWPVEMLLGSEGAPVQLLAVEAEKTNDNKLSILIAAYSDEKESNTTTKELLTRVLPSLRCDFRKGGVVATTLNDPVHRSWVGLTFLQEDGSTGAVAAKITCELPPTRAFDVDHAKLELKSKGPTKALLLPKIDDLNAMSKSERQFQESYQWLHWQLSLLQNEPEIVETSTAGKSWLSATSLPLCDLSNLSTVLAKRRFWSKFNPPTADDYGARGSDASNEKSTPVQDVALCVAPKRSTPSLGRWMETSVEDWVNYQNQVVGFSAVFYLDPFGDELISKWPGLDDAEIVHVPHTARFASMSEIMNDGIVAEMLSQERCSMMSRRLYIEYILSVEDPMSLIVPLKRKKYALGAALGEVLDGVCADKVDMSKIPWSFETESFRKATEEKVECDEEWCNLPQASNPFVQFLLEGGPVAFQSTASLSFWNAKTFNLGPSPCVPQISLPESAVRLIASTLTNNESTSDDPALLLQNDALRRVLRATAVWARKILQTVTATKEHERNRFRLSHPVTKFISTDQPYLASAVHMCRKDGDIGPTYGEAAILRSSGTGARLTFFNAEVHNASDTGHPILSLSTYVENKASIQKSLYHEYSWGTIVNGNITDLEEVSCVFLHPDPRQRLAGHVVRTQGKWKGFWNALVWLECTLPPELYTLDSSALSSVVSIESGSASISDLHMIRPIQLCFGSEQGYKSQESQSNNDGFCDDSSIACKVGCIDDLKSVSDPHAKCCNRCHDPEDPYSRFDERDFWVPTSLEESGSQLSAGMKQDELSDDLKNGDLSICLRPFYLDTPCSECDGIEPFSAQRLIEWVEYHLLIGVDTIYILDRYGDSLLPFLLPYIQSGRVGLLPFPLLSDVALSHEGRSESSKVAPSFHDQVMAYDHCLSYARRQNDLFTAVIDLDEFIRYPESQAGNFRSHVEKLLSQNSINTMSELPDSFLLERFDVTTGSTGFALQYTERDFDPLVNAQTHQQHGKVLANPRALLHGAALVHQAMREGPCGTDLQLCKPHEKQFGTNSVSANANELSVFHYREYNAQRDVDKKQMKKRSPNPDHTLQWAHDILSTQFIGSPGWDAIRSLHRQGVLQIQNMRSQMEQSSRPTLFIGILSYCRDNDRRMAVRQSWLSSEVIESVRKTVDVQWKFFLGQHSDSEQSEHCHAESLKREAEEFGDLAILDDLPESYQVLTRKTLAMFKWAADNIEADFVFKTDDDSYLNVAALAGDIAQVESADRPLYWGTQNQLWPWLSADFSLYPKWYIRPEDFPEDTQTYATGAGYMLSRPLVHHLADMIGGNRGSKLQVPWGPEEHLGWLEDASVGFLLRGALNRGGHVDASPSIQDTWFLPYCSGEIMIMHHLSASQQLDLHKVLHPRRSIDNNECLKIQDLQVSIPPAQLSDRIANTAWSGSFLDRPVSPLLVSAPPKDLSGHHVTAPNGRDVIVVTGGLHNIGRALIEKIQEGFSRLSGPLTVLALDVQEDSDDMFAKRSSEFAGLDVHVVTMQVDITDSKALLGSLTPYKSRIRGVVHLAAVARVQDCHADLSRCKEVNVGGTKNILTVLWKMFGGSAGASDHDAFVGRPALPWLIFASSREVYGALEPGVVADETSVLQPLNVYGETKMQAETLIEAWARKTGFNAVTVRFTNVYGGCWDHQSRLVPNVVSKLVSGEPFEIFGGVDKTISFLHINDAVQSLFLAMGYAQQLTNGAGIYEAFNIGGGPTHDVKLMKDLVEISQVAVKAEVADCKYCDDSVNDHVVDTGKLDRSPEPEHFRASVDKAFRVLGYHPSRELSEETLRRYVHTCVLDEASRWSQFSSNIISM